VKLGNCHIKAVHLIGIVAILLVSSGNCRIEGRASPLPVHSFSVAKLSVSMSNWRGYEHLPRLSGLNCFICESTAALKYVASPYFSVAKLSCTEHTVSVFCVHHGIPRVNIIVLKFVRPTTGDRLWSGCAHFDAHV
jgi:hypothetical protein